MSDELIIAPCPICEGSGNKWLSIDDISCTSESCPMINLPIEAWNALSEQAQAGRALLVIGAHSTSFGVWKRPAGGGDGLWAQTGAPWISSDLDLQRIRSGQTAAGAIISLAEAVKQAVKQGEPPA